MYGIHDTHSGHNMSFTSRVSRRSPSSSHREARRQGNRACACLSGVLKSLTHSQVRSLFKLRSPQPRLVSAVQQLYNSTVPLRSQTNQPTTNHDQQLPSLAPAIFAANATYLHAPAELSGRVVAGPPPTTAPPCSTAAWSASGTSPGASSGASPGTSGRCRRCSSTTAALQSHRR